MNTTGVPWFGPMAWQAHGCHQLAWFVCGWIEREQILNMRSCAQWWLRTLAASADPFGSWRALAAGPDGRGLRYSAPP